MTEATNRDHFGAVILSWKDERSNEISKIVLRLIRYNERILSKRLVIHESRLDPDSFESCTRDDHYRTNVGMEEDTGGLREDVNVEWGGSARQNIRDARIHSDREGIMKDHYECMSALLRYNPCYYIYWNGIVASVNVKYRRIQRLMSTIQVLNLLQKCQSV